MLLIFRNPQFRLLWAASAGSMIGTGTLMMLAPWLTLELTDSPFWVGVTAGAGGIGLLIFSPLSGVLVDRFDRRLLLAAVTAVQAVWALVIATAIFMDAVELWLIITVSFFYSVSHSIRMPALTALALDVAGKGNLLRGLAAIQMAMGAMGTVAPLMAGFVVARFGMGWAFIIIVAADLVGAVLFLALRSPDTPYSDPVPSTTRTLAPWNDLKEALRFAWSSPAVRLLLGVSVATELFVWAHEPLVSVMARDVLGTDASGLGYLLAAAHLGGVVGALGLASGGWVRADGRLVMIGMGGFAFFLVAFAASRNIGLSMTMMALAYAMAAVYEAALGTILQTVVPDRMRGRMLSLQTMTWGLTGISGFYMGAIAHAAGAPIAIGVSAGVVVVLAVLLLRRAMSVIPAGEASALEVSPGAGANSFSATRPSPPPGGGR